MEENVKSQMKVKCDECHNTFFPYVTYRKDPESGVVAYTFECPRCSKQYVSVAESDKIRPVRKYKSGTPEMDDAVTKIMNDEDLDEDPADDEW